MFTNITKCIASNPNSVFLVVVIIMVEAISPTRASKMFFTNSTIEIHKRRGSNGTNQQMA
jgi:hypothetical protein